MAKTPWCWISILAWRSGGGFGWWDPVGLAWFDTLGIGVASWSRRRGIDVGEAENGCGLLGSGWNWIFLATGLLNIVVVGEWNSCAYIAKNLFMGVRFWYHSSWGIFHGLFLGASKTLHVKFLEKSWRCLKSYHHLQQFWLKSLWEKRPFSHLGARLAQELCSHESHESFGEVWCRHAAATGSYRRGGLFDSLDLEKGGCCGENTSGNDKTLLGDVLYTYMPLQTDISDIHTYNHITYYI